MCRRINLFNNNTTVVRDETKSRIICLEVTNDIFFQIIIFLWKEQNERSDAKQLIKQG